MARKVTIAPAAVRDLDAARRWLRQAGAGKAAAAKLAAIRSSIRDLKEAPCRWPVGAHAGTREIPVGGYRVVYEVDPDTGDNTTAGDVQVLRVFGPGQLRDRL